MITLTVLVYAPAAAYAPPPPAPFQFGVDTLSIEELLSAPATRDILAKDAPWVLFLAKVELFRPYISNYTVRDAALNFPMDMSKSVTAVDEALRQLPRSEWPASVR